MQQVFHQFQKKFFKNFFLSPFIHSNRAGQLAFYKKLVSFYYTHLHSSKGFHLYKKPHQDKGAFCILQKSRAFALKLRQKKEGFSRPPKKATFPQKNWVNHLGVGFWGGSLPAGKDLSADGHENL